MPHRASRTLTAVLAAMVFVLASAGLGGSAAALATRTVHTVSYDGYSLMIDGRRTSIWSGEFHYARLPSPSLWLDVLQKLRAAGFDAVSVYFDWAYHSPKPGVYDFSGVRDVDRLLDMAAQAGLYVIARPGPYINAEVDSGGFPAWLDTRPGHDRGTDPAYLAAADEWLGHVDPILARHQLTNGTGTVIAYQVENEFYDGSAAGRAYMAHLEDRARADGITVPLTGNNNGTFNSGAGALDIDGADSYPQGFTCSHPQSWHGVPDISYDHPAGKPLYTAEFQGGSFDPWGGSGYDKCRRLTGPDFASVFYKNNIAVGATMQNLYMTYGGTSWGWQADPSQVYTSYDYGAPITESRQLTAKYQQDKLLGYFLRSVAPVTKTVHLAATPPTSSAIRDTARINPDDGTQFHVLRHADATSTGTDSTHIALDLGAHTAAAGRPAARARTYRTVPQQPGTSITFAGRDSKIIVADYRLGAARLQYSTSEIMTQAQIAGRDIALLYGRDGQDGETVLSYEHRPTVEVLAGKLRTTWDASTGDLRLDYTHTGLARVLITGGTRPLLLLLGTDEAAEQFWQAQTAAGPVLVRGSDLLRGAGTDSGRLDLTGDSSAAGPVEVFAADAPAITWNGRVLPTQPTTSGTRLGSLPGAAPVTLPALTEWKHAQESPESRADFDDSGWRAADLPTTNSTTTPGTLPVLFADDYGFHHGDVWYRGRFQGAAAATGITLSASTGRAGVYSAWLNGAFLGSSGDGRHTFAFPAGTVRAGAGNEVSVLVENMGHNEDWRPTDSNKAARGLTGAALEGVSGQTVSWRIQGSRGGEDLADPVRGPMNTGGLYGERAGWSLPGFPDGGWPSTTLPASDTAPGVSWYRTTVTLDLPGNQDTSVGLRISDDQGRRYRALIFVNGWQLGRYVSDLGPQHEFPLPNGILRTGGANSVAIAVWNTDATGGGLGRVSLENLGSSASPLDTAQVDSPGYSADVPARLGGVRGAAVTLGAADPAVGATAGCPLACEALVRRSVKSG